MFISIDGPDGAGKTTLAGLLAERLTEKGYKAIRTTEPTDSELGKEIRRRLAEGGVDDAELLKMFLDDRREHIKSFIEPKEQQGFIVITDRYKYSTVCYQHLQGVPLDELINLNRDFKKPDLSFILYADDISVLMRRIGSRSEVKDFFETEGLITACNKLYRDMPRLFPGENIVMLNAEAEAGEVLERVVRRVLDTMLVSVGRIGL